MQLLTGTMGSLVLLTSQGSGLLCFLCALRLFGVQEPFVAEIPRCDQAPQGPPASAGLLVSGSQWPDLGLLLPPTLLLPWLHGSLRHPMLSSAHFFAADIGSTRNATFRRSRLGAAQLLWQLL